jgi:hypothetical protein
MNSDKKRENLNDKIKVAFDKAIQKVSTEEKAVMDILLSQTKGAA